MSDNIVKSTLKSSLENSLESSLENVPNVPTNDLKDSITNPLVNIITYARYKGDELTQRVAEIIKVPFDGWEIVDSFENLHMVHYKDDADMYKVGHVRGILVDVEAGCIVASSFGYTPVAVESSLKVTENGEIIVMDEHKFVHSFPKDEFVIKKVFEGVVIRVILYKGKVYHLTHRKINCSRSRWGSSPKFMEMYSEAGGPKDEELFDLSKQYSSDCYIFLIVHPSLLIATRQTIEVPYIVHLDTLVMNLNYPVEEIGFGNAKFEVQEKMNGYVGKSIIHKPSPLTIGEANVHLDFGYFEEFKVKDERQKTGEAIIIYLLNKDGSVKDIVKVHSPSYEWRSMLRSNDPNIVHRFYEIGPKYSYLDFSKLQDLEEFKKKFILFPLYPEELLQGVFTNNKSIVNLPEGEVDPAWFIRKDAKLYVIWMNYVLSLPFNMQKLGLSIIEQFAKDRDAIVEFLFQHHEKCAVIETDEDLIPRAKAIISCARTMSKNDIANNKNFSQKGVYLREPVLVKTKIRNFIRKESGPSLYSLVRSMKKPPRILSEKKTVPKGKEETI